MEHMERKTRDGQQIGWIWKKGRWMIRYAGWKNWKPKSWKLCGGRGIDFHPESGRYQVVDFKRMNGLV